MQTRYGREAFFGTPVNDGIRKVTLMSLTTGKLWITSPSEEVFTIKIRIGG
jgi:hypothetical protein